MRHADAGLAPQAARHLDDAVEPRSVTDLALYRQHQARHDELQSTAHRRCPGDGHSIKSLSYLDLAGAYTFNQSITLRVGINNITDKDPPLIGQDSCLAVFCNGNTFPQLYDTLGRYGFVSVTADF